MTTPQEAATAASEVLQETSKIGLRGGGTLLFVVIAAEYAINVHHWTINGWLIFTALVGAVLLGTVSAFSKWYDARLRVHLAEKLMDIEAAKGTKNDGTTGNTPATSSVKVPGQIVDDLIGPTDFVKLGTAQDPTPKVVVALY